MIQASLFDTLSDGTEITAYTLKNKQSASLKIITWGGIMQSLLLPDAEGRFKDVICGFDSVDDYVKGGGYQGMLIGRYANRIQNGTFSLGGKTYHVTCNENARHHLHGGFPALHGQIWHATPMESEGKDTLILTHTYKDGEEGYPGNLEVKVSYTFDDANTLRIEYEAKTDADTPVNLTSHTYYNLSGFDGDCVMDHLLILNSEAYDSVDDDLIPDQNAPAPVKGTRFDFTAEKPIATPIDHNFHLLGAPRAPKHAATYTDPVSGRTLTVTTDLPAIQIYTACVMDGETAFKEGIPQRPLHAIAFETQFAPNSPNRDDLPCCILPAGEVFRSFTEFAFDVTVSAL